MRPPVPADHYRSYHDLASAHAEGLDFTVTVIPRRQSRVAVIAPHGGRIEGGTSEIAAEIAGADHNLYLFEGQRTSGDNFDRLHLTSNRFDEPRCLELIGRCDAVIAVHGYATDGPDVLLGGRDEMTKGELEQALLAAGLTCLSSGHPFPGQDPMNVCNRGARRAGVQIELSRKLRRSRQWQHLVAATRSVLERHGVACS